MPASKRTFSMLRISPTLRLPLAVAIALVVALVIQFVQLAHAPRGDFPNHWEFGRRMAVGEAIYAGGLNVVYPPLWSLAHAPLTIMPRHTAQLVLFPLFVAALVLLVGVLRELTMPPFPVPSGTGHWVAALAVLLTGRFLFRDMVECGVNLALVALSWLAIYLWVRRREWCGGLCLGLAVSLKCTPLAFLGYFLWKRQWKMAAATTLGTALFTLAPAVWMGPTAYGDAMSLWFSYARRSISQQDPNSGVLGEEKVQNLSLRPALAALFTASLNESSSASHEPRTQAAISPAVVGTAIKTALAVLALSVAWQFRARVNQRNSPAILWECAIISLAILLYSPITWTQHCVGILPAMYLLVLSARSPGRVPQWAWLVVAGYVLAILVLNRAVLGRELSLALLGYHVHVWSLFGLFFVALACHQRAVASGSKDALENFAEPCTLRGQIPLHT